MRRVHSDGADHLVVDEKESNPVPLNAACYRGLTVS